MSSSIDRRGLRWTSEEDDSLIQELLDGKTIKEMAFLHERTEFAIMARLVGKAQYKHLHIVSSITNIPSSEIIRMRAKNKDAE